MDTQITFRHLEPSPSLEEHVRRRAAKLPTFHDRVGRCRVTVEDAHRHSRQGKRYHVRIDLTVPGGELVVKRDPAENLQHEDAHACIDSAFDDAERQLEDWARLKRGDVKHHESELAHAHVKRTFPVEGYGFLETASGDDVYFHRNAVLDPGFDRLQVGDRVRYAAEDGDKGPQATFVERLRHPRPPQPSSAG